jgi:hypothetical protein
MAFRFQRRGDSNLHIVESLLRAIVAFEATGSQRNVLAGTVFALDRGYYSPEIQEMLIAKQCFTISTAKRRLPLNAFTFKRPRTKNAMNIEVAGPQCLYAAERLVQGEKVYQFAYRKAASFRGLLRSPCS